MATKHLRTVVDPTTETSCMLNVCQCVTSPAS